jgi:hypothetical protein
MFIVEYLYLTPSVYKNALERTQNLIKNDEDMGSTLIYNENSYCITNILYNDILHARFFLYRTVKYIIELWQNLN